VGLEDVVSDWTSAQLVGIILLSAFIARIGWAIGGVAARALGISEPIATHVYNGDVAIANNEIYERIRSKKEVA
jgi:plasmid maintenance system antidote protein VapI